MEDYLVDLYAWISSTDPTFEEREPYEEWKKKIGKDQKYQEELYGWISSVDNTFEEREPFNLWADKVKKKDDSQLTSPDQPLESDTPMVQDPGSSDISQEEIDAALEGDLETIIGQVPDEFGGGDVTQFEAGRRRRGQQSAIDKSDRDMAAENRRRRDEGLTPIATGEKDTWLERTVGKNEVTDFFGDLWRAGAKGFETGNTVDEALELSLKGASASKEDIADFVRVNEQLSATGPSDEMKAFNKAYSAAGGGAWGFIKGIMAAPTSITEIAVTSVAQMVNPAVAAGAGTGAAGGAAVGSTGFSAGPLGVFTTAGGAIAGALGGAGATLEAGLSFSEFLQEELSERGLEFNEKNVGKILQDEDAMFNIRTKSAGRGATIGIIDAFTGGIAGKIFKGVGKTAIKAGKTAKRANLRALGASTVVEGLGGGVGEATARGLVGQEMDAAEIGFEIVGGAPGSAITMLRNVAGRGKYTMGPDEAPVTFEQMVKIIEETDDATFAGMKLKIKGDQVLKGMAEDRKDKLKQKKAKMEQLGEDLDGLSVEDAEAAIELETELDKVSGGLTRAKKNRKKEIESQLDEIYSRRQEPAVEAVVEVTTEEAVADLKQENNIRERNGMEVILESEENIEKQRQQLLKEKQDAIQESSATEVDVQEQTQDGAAVGEGDTTGGVTVESESETEVSPEATQEEIEQGAADLEDLLAGLTDSPVNLGDGTRGRNVTEAAEETSVEVVSDIDEAGDPVMAPAQPGVEVSENLTVVDQTETDSHYGSENFRRENPNETPQQHEEMLMERVDKALKSVKRLFPKLKIVMHRSEASYKDNVSTNSRGAFNPNTNTIHINMPKATGRTIGHEVFHAILKDRFGSEVNIQAATKDLIKSLREGINKSTNLTPEQVLELERYAQIFDGDKAIVQDEEFLAEFVGFLSETYSKLEVPQQTAIKQWLAKIAQIFGFSPQEVLAQADRDVVDLLNTIAEKVAEGQEITETDVAMLGTEEKVQGERDTQVTERQVLEPKAKAVLQKAKDFVSKLREKRITLSQIRKKFGLNYKEGGQVLDQLEDDGVVETFDGAPGRKIVDKPAPVRKPTPVRESGPKKAQEKTGEGLKTISLDRQPPFISGVSISGTTFDTLNKKSLAGGTVEVEAMPRTKMSDLKGGVKGQKIKFTIALDADGKMSLRSITDDSVVTPEGREQLEAWIQMSNDVATDNVGVVQALGIEGRLNTLRRAGLGGVDMQVTEIVGPKSKEGGRARKQTTGMLDVKTQEIEGGQKVSEPANALKTQAIGAFEVSYTQQEKVAQMIKEGLITEPDDVSFLKGNDTVITSPDDMLVGEISLNGKPIFEGGGGVFFVTKYGDVWAAGKKDPAKRIAEGINRGLKQNGGKGYLTLTKGADKKLVSSAAGVNSTLAILDSMLDEGLVSPSNFRAAVSSAVKRAGGEIDLRGSSKKLKADVNEYFSDPSTTTFEKRGNIVESIVGEIAKSLPKELRPKVVQFLGGDPNKSVGATKTPKSQRLVDLVAGVAAEKLTKGLKTGDVYAVIEVDGEVEVVKGDHKSYPWHVKLKDGSKPILHLPKNREAGSKALVQKSGKPYAVRNVSVVEGKFQGQTEGIKTQAIVENTTEEVNRLKGLEKKPDDGATLNIDGTQYTGGGLVVPAATKNTTQSELTPQMIEKFVKDNDGKIGTDGIVKVGLYKFPKSDQVSIDLNIVVPAKNEKIALEFGRLAGQESLFSLDTFKNIKTGATGANPVSFTDAQFRQIAKDLNANKVPKVFEGDIKTQIFNKNMTVEDIIKFGRENNFSDAMIKDYLVRVKKEKVKEVNKMMAIDADMFRQMPVSFGNIEGGARAGVKLFARVEKFMEKLNAKNKKRKEGNRISEREIMDQTIEFLEKQPEYIAESGKRKQETDQQTQMIIDMQKALGVNPTKGMNTRIREMRQKMMERRRGGMDLQAVKRDLRNFIRQALPTIKGSTYSKSELMNLLGKVTKADKKNIANLMDEVVDIVTKRQVKALDSKIESILNGKYEVVQSGRLKGVKIDNETRKRLAAIKEVVTDEAATADDIVKSNESLNEMFNALAEKVDQTDQDRNDMVDLMIVMSINNSKLMDDTNVIKVESLSRAEEMLSGIIGEGREMFKEELQAAHAKYNEQFAKVFKDVTGRDVDVNDPDVVNEINEATDDLKRSAEATKANDNKVVKFIKSLNPKNLFVKSETIEGLMERIAEAPGVLLGGNARKLVYEGLNEGIRGYKKRMMETKKAVSGKMKEVYGKKWRRTNKDNSVKQVVEGIYTNPEAVKKAQDQYDANPTKKNKKALQKVKQDKSVILSKNQVGYLYMQLQDPANTPAFENMESLLGEDYKRTMDELVEWAGKDVVAMAEWQMNEFYPSMYPEINEAYKNIYRTDLPWNENYGGRMYREGEVIQPLDLLGEKGRSPQANSQVAAASTKMRQARSKPIMPVDMMNALVTYSQDMQWFANVGPTIRDINKLFTNPLMRKAITNAKGEVTMDMIDHAIKNIANRGLQTERGNDFVNSMNNLFATTRLGISPNIAIKQLTSIPTYALDIGAGNYLYYAVKNKTEFLKVFNEIRENSVYLQDRLSTDIRQSIEAYSAKGLDGSDPASGVFTKGAGSFFVNLMMGFVKAGDITAIYLGGMPNYSYYKAEFMRENPQATPQEAIDYAVRKFESDTKSTQQSMDVTDKDYFQTSSPFNRALNMFKTSPKQYLRKEMSGLRNMRRGFRDKNLKQFMGGLNKFLMYHVMMPVGFQFVAAGMGLAGWDEEDNKDIARAAILGNFNSLFLVGDILQGLSNTLAGRTYGKDVGTLPVFDAFGEINEQYLKWNRLKDPQKKEEAFIRMTTRIGELALAGRIPLYNITRFYKNIEKAASASDTQEAILRLLNYSDYVIEGNERDTQSAPKTREERDAERDTETSRKKREEEKRRKDRDKRGRR